MMLFGVLAVSVMPMHIPVEMFRLMVEIQDKLRGKIWVSCKFLSVQMIVEVVEINEMVQTGSIG